MYKNFLPLILIVTLFLGACININRVPGTVTPENTANISTISPTINLPATIPISEPVMKLTRLHDWSLESIGDIHWAPDSNKFVLTFPYSKSPLAVYDVKTYAKLWDDSLRTQVYGASTSVFSPDGRYIYAGLAFPIGVQKRDANTGELLSEGEENYQNSCYPGLAHDVVLSQDGRTLYFLVEDNTKEGAPYSELISWDIASLKCNGSLVRAQGYARSLKISSDGRFLAIGISEGLSSYLTDHLAEKGHTIIWDLRSNKNKCVVLGTPIVFMPENDGVVAFESNEDQNSWINQIKNWNIEQCRYIDDLTQIIPPGYILPPMSITPDGKVLGVAQGKIMLLNASTGEILFEIDNPSPTTSDLEHQNDILSFSPDGYYMLFATSTEPGKSLVVLWKLEASYR